MSRKPASGTQPGGTRADAEAGKERMDFRLDADHKALIERAAAYRGETVTGYAISTLVREAQQVIREHEVITLTGRDRDRFIELLASPPEPTAALRRAARRHQELITGSD